MILFKDLKSIITKCCQSQTSTTSSEWKDKFSFTIDLKRLENELNRRDSELHVLAFNEKQTSNVTRLEDIQWLTEYLHKDYEISTTFNGEAQIIKFMLFSDTGIEGKIEIKHDDFDLQSTDICSYIIDNPDNNIMPVMTSIVNQCPTYGVVIVRWFSTKKDKFEYSVYFRSNTAMINYIKELKIDIDK